MTAAIEAKGISYSYEGGLDALSNVDLSVAKRRKLAIVGSNGAGKTTLLLHLNGTLRPSSGHVIIDGERAQYGRRDMVEWRRRVGLVLQDADDQLFASSVFNDVSFGPLNLGLEEAETRVRVANALAAMAITDLADRPPHMLSHGQKKSVAIAGAVAMRPRVLLLDEPTAGLDRQRSQLLLTELERLSIAGTTLVFSTQDVDLAWAFADDVALFENGRIIAQGAVEQMLTDADCLSKCGLVPPLLARIGVLLRKNGLVPDGENLPRSEATAISLLEQAIPDRFPS